MKNPAAKQIHKKYIELQKKISRDIFGKHIALSIKRHVKFLYSFLLKTNRLGRLVFFLRSDMFPFPYEDRFLPKAFRIVLHEISEKSGKNQGMVDLAFLDETRNVRERTA